MKLRIEIDVAERRPAEMIGEIAYALVRYAQALQMLGFAPSLSPLWSEGKQIGRAWVDQDEHAEPSTGVE